MWPGDPGVANPVLLSKIEPDYPDRARRAGVEARVLLEAVVRRDGSVGDIRVLFTTSPGLGFESAAMAAVERWRYRPGERDGLPVDIYFHIAVNFELL